ncbi:MAG: MBL fold metallo-hydrolase [Bacteroidota bacterium]
MKIQYRHGGITVFESALFQTTSTVVITEEYVLVVDPNWLPEEVMTIATYVENVARGKARYLLFTHSDYDHIIGYGAFPGWTTIASQRFVDNPDREAQIQQARDWDDEYYVKRSYALTYPEIQLPVVGDDVVLPLPHAAAIRCYQAPGHNYDGLVTYLPHSGILIVGDYLSEVEFPYVYHSFANYRRVLARLSQIMDEDSVELLVSGHGKCTTDPVEMRQRVVDAYAYLDGIEAHVRKGAEFDEAALFARYGFPGIMGKFHAKNLSLLQKELASRSNNS